MPTVLERFVPGLNFFHVWDARSYSVSYCLARNFQYLCHAKDSTGIFVSVPEEGRYGESERSAPGFV